MDKEEIQDAIYKAINIVQEMNGENKIAIKKEIIPRFDLNKFDSLCEINVIVELEDILKVEFKEKNIFIDKDKKPRNIEQIITYIHSKFKS